MKVKELITELQKHDPEVEIFTGNFLQLFKVDSIKKIKFEKVKEEKFSFVINTNNGTTDVEGYNEDCYYEKAKNTNNEKAILIN